MEINKGTLLKVEESDIIHGSFIFPPDVSIIGHKCFIELNNLKELIVPPKITHIYDYAFYHCQNLKKCSFQNPYVKLEMGVLSDCTSLTEGI